MGIYYALTKPGIVIGNLITTVAGFLLACKGGFNPWLFIATALGLAFVMGSACVCNNFIDRHADEKMARTKNRPLPSGRISGTHALIFATLLGSTGAWILFAYTSILAGCIALFGFFFYVAMYSFWKYRSVYGTLVGSISGAVPPVVGYTAVSQQLDLGALILFAILVLWQMPHFYSIAVYRHDDYKAASIPVLPVKKGMRVTKVHMFLYIIAYLIAISLLTFFGYAGYAYLTVGLLTGILWLHLCLKGFKTQDDILWARQMFRFSLIVVTAVSLSLMCSARF
ncbi:MAG: protoheme IX farnesyltransferase [Verrucomicrobia bacterium]|nr:protoheme IX farnesyltransferase [Verrucomicrobiota bacterium]